MTPNALATELVFLALVEVLERRREKTIPNVLMRELQGIHRNTTMNDLDNSFKTDIRESGAILMSAINKAGYKLVPKDS